MVKNQIKIYGNDDKVIHKIEDDIVTRLVNSHIGPHIPKHKRKGLKIQVGNGVKEEMHHTPEKAKDVNKFVKSVLLSGKGCFTEMNATKMARGSDSESESVEEEGKKVFK